MDSTPLSRENSVCRVLTVPMPGSHTTSCLSLCWASRHCRAVLHAGILSEHPQGVASWAAREESPSKTEFGVEDRCQKSHGQELAAKEGP